jgi:hypothetical protein
MTYSTALFRNALTRALFTRLRHWVSFAGMNREQGIRPTPQAHFQQTGETSVILNLSTERYYGLDETGTRFWQLMTEHRKLGPVFDRMLREYDVEADRLERDITRLIQELAGFDLLQVDREGGEAEEA